MYISPNSKVNICAGVSFDNTYVNTTKFADLSSQLVYFNSKTVKSLVKLSYVVRDGEMVTNKIRVSGTADSYYNANYLFFQNSSFGNKWFFAFITGIKYINNDTTELTYEIDVIQTWQFDWNVLQCFVEREHTLTDNIGDNLVQDNLEIGDYVYDDLGLSSLFSAYQIVMACTFDKDLNPAQGGWYGGVYSGLCYNVFANDTQANDFISRATADNKADGIISIFMLPIAFCYGKDTVDPSLYFIERDKNYSNIDGYVPKNKKLFTYPYNMLYVTNNEGVCANYPFEYFLANKCTFRMSGAMCCTPEVMIYPLQYKGVENNYNESLTMGNFPQCAFTIDTFKAFVAQNTFSVAKDVITGVVQTGAGIALASATGGVLGVDQAISGGMNIASTLASVADKSTLPPQAKGGHNSIINMAKGIKGFQFFYAHIRAEFAKIIDGYWSKFGYPIKRVKVPSIGNRPVWNYIKTSDACITGNIPANDLQKIRNIFNNGVTFWKNPNNVGRYDLDNSPT